MTPTMINNISSRNHVKRSKKREDYEAAKVEKSRMVAVGINVDQNGYLRPPHNTGKMEEDQRFDLLQDSDHILDGIIFVKTLFFC